MHCFITFFWIGLPGFPTNAVTKSILSFKLPFFKERYNLFEFMLFFSMKSLTAFALEAVKPAIPFASAFISSLIWCSCNPPHPQSWFSLHPQSCSSFTDSLITTIPFSSPLLAVLIPPSIESNLCLTFDEPFVLPFLSDGTYVAVVSSISTIL